MIKFLDLEKINNRFRSEIDRRISSILDRGWYLQGSENEKFCKNFANYCGTEYCVGVANGLDALTLIIKAYGFGPGDEIIVPSNTYIATILSVSANGCVPVLVEDCACAMYLRKSSLRDASYPFDWLCHATFERRIECLKNHFDGFLEKENMRRLDKPTTGLRDLENDSYEDVNTGFYFYHDFKENVPFDIVFSGVKNKYERRIERLYKNIEKCKKVLFVWWSRDKRVDVDTILDLLSLIRDGNGVSLHPIGSASREKDLVFLSELGYGEEHDFWIATRKDYVQRPEVKVLIECIRDATLKI